MTNNVLFSVNDNGVATLTLNRPKALNSLSHDMVQQIGKKLKEWETDEAVCLVIIKGEGDKGFCAGGDIKSLYESRSSESALLESENFFAEEYQVDMQIYHFPKPIIACLDGIVMGGGVGLTYGASHRIVTERTKWAMPEMNIAFFPDVGAAYFLNKAPGHIGRYLALTASVIQAADVLHIKAADIYMSSEALQSFLSTVEKFNWHKQNVQTTLQQLINDYSEAPNHPSTLAHLQKEIDHHFSFETIEKIIASLEKNKDKFAEKTKATLLSKSPFSIKITLKQLIEGEEKSMEECFTTDLILAKNFMRHSDFFEGVRAVLIDKDQAPQYKYRQISDVSEEGINAFFSGN